MLELSPHAHAERSGFFGKRRIRVYEGNWSCEDDKSRFGLSQLRITTGASNTRPLLDSNTRPLLDFASFAGVRLNFRFSAMFL